MLRSRFVAPSILVTLGLLAATQGCSGAPPASESTSTSEDPIIGGVDAKSASLDAVGIFLLSAAALPPTPDAGTDASPESTPDASPESTPDASPESTPDASPESDAGTNVGPNVTTATRARALDKLPLAQRARATIDGKQYYAWCTGTLVSPTVVVTAEHCTEVPPGYELSFATGSDFRAPKKIVPVLTLKAETTVTGGAIGLGSDVAVAHLDEPIDGVGYFTIGALKSSDLGRNFSAIGYGSQGLSGAHGTRKAGTITLKGLEGNVFDLAYGGYDAWAQKTPELYGFPREWLAVAELQQQLHDIYASRVLLNDYEAFLGAAKGNAQPCHGDSGGPLVASPRKLVGVASWVSYSNGSTYCQDGVVYATLGPAATAFVQDQLADVCSGVSNTGLCRGAQAIRCTTADEGERRLTRTDCEILGQTCGLDETGAAACVDP